MFASIMLEGNMPFNSSYVVHVPVVRRDKDTAQAFVSLRLIISPKMLHLLAS